MVAEEMEEFALAFEESAYEDPEEQGLVGFMTLGGEYN